jgi:ubiquinone/menaquinone biosynthesis C-methylase UbiE
MEGRGIVNEQRTRADVVHGDELCIRDPGGDDRVVIAPTADDHAPPHDPDALDAVFAPVLDALLATADLRPARSPVLDIGCGCGAPTFAAADAVSPHGTVDGIDITDQVLDIARSRQKQSHRRGVTFIKGDAQTYRFKPERYETAISRFGTMFFQDQVAALTNIRTALRPGGRLCFATWQPLDANAWLVIPGAALLHWIELPDFSGSGPGMFAQSDPAVITNVLHDAGYNDVAVAPMKLALRFGADPIEATARLSDIGTGRRVLSAIPENARPAAVSAVETALADHADTTGVHLGAAILITTATA